MTAIFDLRKMKAIVYTKPGELKFQDVPIPEPVDGNVLINVEAVGICGSELEGFRETSPLRVPPLIMGHEFTGRRADNNRPIIVNPLISCYACDMCLRGGFNLCRERRVIGIHCSGGFAEQVLVPERNLYDRPRSLDPLQAALAEPFANAVHAFRLLVENDGMPRRVGVIGGGMLGLATAIVALHRGVDVALTDTSMERQTGARRAQVPSVGSELVGEFDAVFDAVGRSETRRSAMEHLRPGGTAVWIGLHAADAGFDGLDLVRFEKRVIGTFCYHHEDFKDAINLLAMVDASWVRSFPLQAGVQVFHELLKTTPTEVKTVLVP